MRSRRKGQRPIHVLASTALRLPPHQMKETKSLIRQRLRSQGGSKRERREQLAVRRWEKERRKRVNSTTHRRTLEETHLATNHLPTSPFLSWCSSPVTLFELDDPGTRTSFSGKRFSRQARSRLRRSERRKERRPSSSAAEPFPFPFPSPLLLQTLL